MPGVQEFFDPATSSFTYIVFDELTRDAVLIDPVLDYDPAASRISRGSLERVAHYIEQHKLSLGLILETHAHADHLSASQEFKRLYPGVKLAIGQGITEVQKAFKELLHLAEDFPCDGRQFDLLLLDGERCEVGSLSFEVIMTPGHTPACASYLFEDKIFVGDALFMPDYGTGRCDFPGGSAATLFHSVKEKLYRLPPSTLLFTGHDYRPQGRALRWQASIAEQKLSNIHINDGTSPAGFINFRQDRDAKLEAPRLLYPSIQVNIDGGQLPRLESNGVAYLRIPLHT